ncbi:MoaD/ThiS family protein [Maridesulfovibrio sp. FT414]|uniref:MoaD/ThiS family protein n=1 Tax=Maridesulfovibrio sp. FT414 TaxID=2979469 RepID=UPI003D80944E
MRIKVVCFSHLGSYNAETDFVGMDDGTRAGEVPGLLGFCADDVAMYFVGDERVGPERVLADGNVLKLFPPITGG